VKVCEHDNIGNMGLYLRRPFPRTDAREARASWPVTLFVMIVSGFVLSELFSEWSAAQAVFLWAPSGVVTFTGLTAHAGWMEGVWALFIVPSIMWLVLGWLVVVRHGAPNLAEAWCRLALPLAVVISAGHMCKGLAKVVSWVGFVPLAAMDPVGVNTARAIAAKSIPQPGAILPMSIVSLLGVLLVITAGYFALRELRLAQPEVGRRMTAPVWVTACCFGLIVFGWGFLQ
jgi:hypothetical protein